MPIQPQAGLARVPPARPFSLSGTLADLANLRTAELQQRKAGLELTAAEDQQRRARQMQAELQTAQNDPRKIVEILNRYDPKLAADVQAKWAEERERALKADQEQVAAWRAQAELGTGMLRFIRESPHPATAYQAARGSLQALLPQGSGLELPPEYAPELVDQLEQLAMTVADDAKRRDEARKLFLDGKTSQALATMYSAATSPQQWNKVTETAKFMDIPDAVIGLFGDFSDANLQRARDLAISPEKQAELEGQAESRAVTMRGQDLSAATQQRGQDISAATQRRGQDIGAANQPLVSIMGPDGKPVLVPRSQAVGQRPIGGSTGGRSVTSGDANRLAELTTSIDDLAVLKGELEGIKGATGVEAQIGANVWNWVTELTGWGEQAKQKQAVIDRVKQVIGKALEGGVLRKEDEEKYKKILPVIGDTAPVVRTKLQGLSSAIQQRYERQLEALEDAGYDTSGFRQRQTVGSRGGDPKNQSVPYKIGDTVTIQGVAHRVTAVFPDGTFNAVPVK